MTTHNLQNVRSLAILFHLIGDEGSDADTTYRHWRILHQEYNPTYTEQMYSPLIRILKQLVFPQKQPIPQEGPRILEIGFGNGHLLKFLMNMGACVVGIEKDEKLVSYARKLGLMHVYHSRGPTLEEVEELPREMCNTYFDTTIAHRVLEEPVMRRKEIERCIHSINNSLREGGYLFVGTWWSGTLPLYEVTTNRRFEIVDMYNFHGSYVERLLVAKKR